jgi:hypothetical protein
MFLYTLSLDYMLYSRRHSRPCRSTSSPCVRVHPVPVRRYGTKPAGIGFPSNRRRMSTSYRRVETRTVCRIASLKQRHWLAVTIPDKHSDFVLKVMMRKHVEECIRLARYSVRVFLERQVRLAAHVTVDKQADARVQQVRRQGTISHIIPSRVLNTRNRYTTPRAGNPGRTRSSRPRCCPRARWSSHDTRDTSWLPWRSTGRIRKRCTPHCHEWFCICRRRKRCTGLRPGRCSLCCRNN